MHINIHGLGYMPNEQKATHMRMGKSRLHKCEYLRGIECYAISKKNEVSSYVIL
jgi:hypothetical protein